MADEPIPGRIGDYIIEGVLGEGGMAKVYKARHAILNTRHAVKVLEPSYRANHEARQRFLDEAKIQASQLDHPNIVKVVNIVATEEHAALVMELIDGSSLESEIPKLVEDPDEIRRIMLAVLDAVGHAHNAGVIHRDLKPANVLLAGKARMPKVTDFGIAKVSREADSKLKSTHVGARMGTLSYMSPEQVLQAKNVTPLSDIFSLGAMLYELATGALPFDAESDYEVMDQIVRGRYVPAEQQNAAIDPQLAAVIGRALAADPDARYANCEEMAEALRGELRNDENVEPRMPGRAPSLVEVDQDRYERWRATEPVRPVGGSMAAQIAAHEKASARAKSSKGAALTSINEQEPRSRVGLIVTILVGPAVLLIIGVALWAAKSSDPRADEPVTSASSPASADTAALHQKACDGGNMSDCNNLGLRYEQGAGVAQDAARAGALFRTACNGGEMEGCMNLGRLYYRGAGVDQDTIKASELFRQSCDGGNANSCDKLGLNYEKGTGVIQDATKAAALYGKACDGGDLGGCLNLGKLVNDQDAVKAAALFEKACNGGEMKGCANLGVLFDRGAGVGRDEAKAAVLFQRACDGGNVGGCNSLGFLYDQGTGVVKDSTKALFLYQKACDGGEMLGCTNLGNSYADGTADVPQDTARALVLYEKACDGGEMNTCFYLGVLFRDGTRVGRNVPRADWFFKKACDGGLRKACK